MHTLSCAQVPPGAFTTCLLSYIANLSEVLYGVLQDDLRAVVSTREILEIEPDGNTKTALDSFQGPKKKQCRSSNFFTRSLGKGEVGY